MLKNNPNGCEIIQVQLQLELVILWIFLLFLLKHYEDFDICTKRFSFIKQSKEITTKYEKKTEKYCNEPEKLSHI